MEAAGKGTALIARSKCSVSRIPEKAAAVEFEVVCPAGEAKP
jgi:hypothetical protein